MKDKPFLDTEMQQIQLHPGQVTVMNFYVENHTDEAMIGRAVPSVSPGEAARYFKKIEWQNWNVFVPISRRKICKLKIGTVLFQYFRREPQSMSTKLSQDVSIGENLRILRKRAGYSQERAAAQLELMGISMSREIISQMESGHHNIRISVLLAFKQVYEVDSFDDFFVQQEKGGDR